MIFLLEGIESERLKYRKIKQSDFVSWLPFFENPVTHKYWIAEHDTPNIECTKWYNKQLWRYQNNKGGMNAVIEKRSGDLIGHCGLLLQTVDAIEELEIAYSFLPQHWSKGYASEAAKRCRDFAFANGLSSSLISIISLTNLPSQKVAFNIGMKIDKQTFYNGNEVYIFRVNKTDHQESGMVPQAYISCM